MTAYVDASFPVSLYTPDSNSVEAAMAMARLPLPVSITPLGELEPVNALRLRLFRKELRPNQVLGAHRMFRQDLNHGIVTVKAIPDTAFAEAQRIASRWSAKLETRTLDILHVASAIGLETDALITFDDRQRRLAKALGLKTSLE